MLDSVFIKTITKKQDRSYKLKGVTGTEWLQGLWALSVTRHTPRYTEVKFDSEKAEEAGRALG